MSPKTCDLLEQSKQLLEKRESEQAAFEAGLRESRRALARSEKTLAELKDTLAAQPRPGGRG
jgi:hypothetical protein